MFYSLKGVLSHIDTNFVVIECSGVGYRIFITRGAAQALPQLGEEIFLYTYMSIKENAIELFGFKSQSEHACFKLLISVSGVGAKLAIGILSELGAEQVAISISSNDVKTLTRASGVGAKLAGRIILELKDKLGKGQLVPIYNSKSTEVYCSTGNAQKAANALEMLGFTYSEASALLFKLDSNLPVEDLIRLALVSSNQ